jgi:hypothetical protein
VCRLRRRLRKAEGASSEGLGMRPRQAGPREREHSFARLRAAPEEGCPAAVYCRSSYLLQRPSPICTRLSS